MDNHDQRGSVSVPYVNYFLIAVNVVVFAAGLPVSPVRMEMHILFGKGLLFAPVILKGQEFHRLITSVFLHADATHLMNNMIMQFAGGDIVERNIGHFRYAVLYLVSGIGGNLTSVLADYINRSYTYSVGASGAVCGVIGALLFLVFEEVRERSDGPGAFQDRSQDPQTYRRTDAAGWNEYPEQDHRRREGLSPRLKSLVIRAGFMMFCLLYSGWVNPMVNQAAHVGGLITGFLFSVFLMPRGRRDLSALLR